MRKKRILFHSNSSLALTGFGKNLKNVLRELFRRGNYEICELANGTTDGDPITKMRPWDMIGSVPNNQHILNEASKDPAKKRDLSYGQYMVDEAIDRFKPDIYVGVEDPWAFSGFTERPWWNKINSMVWTTLDSVPIYPEAIDIAPATKHYYVWAEFAKRELNRLGYNQVDVLHGSMDTSNFNKLDELAIKMLKSIFNLDNQFIIGFVFRNQLRKSAPNILDGFKLFKEKRPDANPKLFFHTCWREGWDIPRLLDEKEIPLHDVLTTYVCSKCGSYDIKPFTRENLSCRFCKQEHCQSTPDTKNGVNEEQLNEIYNLMDVYCHPFTSGGQEMPIQEAKLAEKITLVTNYSCGEDCCTEESGGLPLSWHEYREPGTQFIKASTDPESICDQINRVYDMPPQERQSWGKKARQFVLDNYSTKTIVDKLEKIFEKMPLVEYNKEEVETKVDLEYSPPSFLSNEDWLVDFYNNALGKQVDRNNSAIKRWSREMSGGIPRENIAEHIKNEYNKQDSLKPIGIEDILTDEGKENRLAIVMPESAVDVLAINRLIKNLHQLYQDKKIYVITKPEFYQMINDNPYVHKLIPYSPICDNILALEGQGDNHQGYFQIAYLPHIGTQRISNYLHNGVDKIQIEIFDTETGETI